MTTPPITGPVRSTTMTTTSEGPDLIGNPARHAERKRTATRLPYLDWNAAVGYARSATTGQEEGVDRQIDGIRRTAAARRLELVQVFADREVSGNKGDREGLSAILDFLQTGVSRPATVFVTSADRLARDTSVSVILWDELRRLGVALHDVENGEIDMRPLTDAGSGGVRRPSGGGRPSRPHPCTGSSPS